MAMAGESSLWNWNSAARTAQGLNRNTSLTKQGANRTIDIQLDSIASCRSRSPARRAIHASGNEVSSSARTSQEGDLH